MSWVRISPFIGNWPGGGGPPVFDINSDENGTAVVELAWDPQALLNPAKYPEPLRYYSSDQSFSASIKRATGSGTLSVNVPAQVITLTANHATWTIPADLWAGYVEESLKSLSSPPATTFSRNLYYRVRATAPGSATAQIWPSDSALNGGNAMMAPHIGVLTMSATPSSQIVPDAAAIARLGGIAFLPTLWADLVTNVWRSLPENDPVRQSLAAVFAHATFAAAGPQLRTDILRLWLFAGPSRRRIPELLARRAVTGTAVATPIVEKIALKGGKTLVQGLLDLLSITPHPDLGAITREQLVDDVLTEILDPNGQVNQGGAGTCVPTSIQTFLITVNPAEYARLQGGWLSSTARAELADGTTAAVPPGIFQLSRYVPTALPSGGTFSATNVGFRFRTFSEMAFQGAILKLGEGSAFPASDGSEASIQAIFRHVYAGGLSQDQTKTAVDALFGVKFKKSAMAWPPSMPNFAATQVAIRDALLQDLPARQQQILFAIYWGTPPSTPVPTGVSPASFFGAHMVLALRHETGRIFFKNPQYAGSNPPAWAATGGNATQPPRHIDDASGSIESFTDGDLAAWMYWYVVPDSAVI